MHKGSCYVANTIYAYYMAPVHAYTCNCIHLLQKNLVTKFRFKPHINVYVYGINNECITNAIVLFLALPNGCLIETEMDKDVNLEHSWFIQV